MHSMEDSTKGWKEFVDSSGYFFSLIPKNHSYSLYHLLFASKSLKTAWRKCHADLTSKLTLLIGLYDVYLCDVVLATMERNSKWLVGKNQDLKEQKVS